MTSSKAKAKSNCSSAEGSESVTDSDAETLPLPDAAVDDDTTLATLMAMKPIKRMKKAGPEEREDIVSALQATFVTDRVRRVTKKDMSEAQISVPLVPPPLWLSKVVGHMSPKLAEQEPLEIVINTWSDCAQGSVMVWQLACNVPKQYYAESNIIKPTLTMRLEWGRSSLPSRLSATRSRRCSRSTRSLLPRSQRATASPAVCTSWRKTTSPSTSWRIS